MTILENNCMQSTASAAGYSTGGTLISAFAAYILLNNQTLPLSLMLGWVFFVAILGVTMAVPMKRQMINVEQLRFPSGIAAAETLRALHAKGEKGMRAARALGIGGILAAVSAFLTDGLRLISPRLESLQISSLVARFSAATLGGVLDRPDGHVRLGPDLHRRRDVRRHAGGRQHAGGFDHLLDDLRPLAAERTCPRPPG